MKLGDYISCNNVNGLAYNLADLRSNLDKAEASYSCLGSRSITIEGYEGQVSWSAAIEVLTAVGELRRASNDLSLSDRIDGLNIARRISWLDSRSVSKASLTARIFTQALIILRSALNSLVNWPIESKPANRISEKFSEFSDNAFQKDLSRYQERFDGFLGREGLKMIAYAYQIESEKFFMINPIAIKYVWNELSESATH